jgi:purine-binding chemotaxis protein CheW
MLFEAKTVDIKKILRKRANELAKEHHNEENADQNLEYVEFILAYENYGIELSYVREVYPLKDFTPVPCTPSFILGVTNIRGEIISVLDIRSFFGLPFPGLTDLNRVIVLRTGALNLGILADKILGVRLVSKNNIQKQIPTLTDKRSAYLNGVTQDRVVILDIEKLISDPELILEEDVEL